MNRKQKLRSQKIKIRLCCVNANRQEATQPAAGYDVIITEQYWNGYFEACCPKCFYSCFSQVSLIMHSGNNTIRMEDKVCYVTRKCKHHLLISPHKLLAALCKYQENEILFGYVYFIQQVQIKRLFKLEMTADPCCIKHKARQALQSQFVCLKQFQLFYTFYCTLKMLMKTETPYI